jgi:hypothetical protein
MFVSVNGLSSVKITIIKFLLCRIVMGQSPLKKVVGFGAGACGASVTVIVDTVVSRVPCNPNHCLVNGIYRNPVEFIKQDW